MMTSYVTKTMSIFLNYLKQGALHNLYKEDLDKANESYSESCYDKALSKLLDDYFASFIL